MMVGPSDSSECGCIALPSITRTTEPSCGLGEKIFLSKRTILSTQVRSRVWSLRLSSLLKSLGCVILGVGLQAKGKLFKIYGFFDLDLDPEKVQSDREEEPEDLEVELINLDYNFRPITSPPTAFTPRSRSEQSNLLVSRGNIQQVPNSSSMAGISEYRRVGATGGFYGYDNPDGHVQHQGAGDEVLPPSGRISSRGEYYYSHPYGASRAISPFSVGNTASPRFGVYPPYIDGAEDQNIQSFATKGAGLVAIVLENLISHPFLVMKRQCQVHTQSIRYHILPVTLLNPIFQIGQRQGAAVLWKGLGSTLVVRGMALAVEDVTSKVTPWPKEVSRHSTTKAMMQHLLLKSLSLAVITPFYSASLVETVQSDVASETAGFFDVFREGFWRLLAWPSTGRLVPVHVLIVPTVAHGLLSYLIYSGVKSASMSAIRRVREAKERKQGALSKDNSLSYYTELTASLVGNMAADIILFPLETVLNRLHLQGTRTIIDSLENGIEVTPILTSYGGILDCLRTTVDDEGVAGLYKGFGALILQYGLQILIIRTMKVVLENSPFGSSSSNASGTSTPPTEKILDFGRTTPPVHHSRSEPGISVTRRTPPTALHRDFQPGAGAGDAEEIRYRSRFSNFSPTSAR